MRRDFPLAAIFSLADKIKWPGLKLPVPGNFNLSNALAAATAAEILGIDSGAITETLNKFKGTWRRFEIVGKCQGAIIISDYAHHPEAIAATVAAARQKYPGKRLIALFQPHQRSRTKKLFAEFVAALTGLENLILAEIYDVPGREKESIRISSRQLANALPGSRYAADIEAAAKILLSAIKPGDIVLIMGAGDVDKIARNIASLDRKGAIY